MVGHDGKPGGEVHEADIVIVGAGAAGAMAALSAHEQGATFVGLDQLEEFGGTAIVSGGGMQVAGSSMQAEQGIEDSPERAFHDMVDGNPEADPEWVRFYYERSVKELYEWLRGHGLPYANITISEGDSVPRRHVPKNTGLGLMTRLREVHEELGLDRYWHLSMTAKDLIVSAGRVVGVSAKDKSGRPHEFRGQTVIVATGGFAGSLPMVLRYSERLRAAGRILAGGGVGALGTGHEILLRHGATLVNVGNVVIYVFATPDYEDPKLERGLVIRGIESCIWVNGAGRRFHNETLQGSVYGPPAVLAQRPPIYWAILDQQMAENVVVSDPRYRAGSEAFRDKIWQLLRESPYVSSGNTLHELAERAGFAPDEFERTVASWDALLASGAERDPETGRKLAGLQPFVEPPFYAMQFWPLARKNQGGVKTDLRCRVLDAAGEVIPGLYAAGELCGFAGGHISGNRSLEGIMIGGSLFSGRVAGAWAAYETGRPEPTHLAPSERAGPVPGERGAPTSRNAAKGMAVTT